MMGDNVTARDKGVPDSRITTISPLRKRLFGKQVQTPSAFREHGLNASDSMSYEGPTVGKSALANERED